MTLSTASSPSARSAAVVPDLTLLEMTGTPFADLESWSPFCVKVNRALQFHGLAYARRAVDRPVLKQHNPQVQWPALLVGDAAVTDSTAILEKLETLSSRSLLPADPRARSEAWLWEEYADTAMNGFFVAARWADEDNWPGVKEAYFAGAPGFVRGLVAPMIRRGVLKSLVGRDVWRAGALACWARFERMLDQLDDRAPEAGFWITEDALTVADIAIFSQLHGLRNPLTARQRDMIRKRSRLSAYLDRVHADTGVPATLPLLS